jgi:Rieske Fe-S protein
MADTPKWQEDFPIDWDEDHYVTRRDLAKFLTLGSGLLVCANAAVAIAANARGPRSYPRTRIAQASALQPGESMLFRYPGPADPCILVRTRGGVLAAYSQVCTHLSCAVVYRRDDDRLFCPCHEGVFECGAPTAGARPLEGPPQRPLPRIALEVVGDDVFATAVVTS